MNRGCLVIGSGSWLYCCWLSTVVDFLWGQQLLTRVVWVLALGFKCSTSTAGCLTCPKLGGYRYKKTVKLQSSLDYVDICQVVIQITAQYDLPSIHHHSISLDISAIINKRTSELSQKLEQSSCSCKLITSCFIKCT